MRIEEPSSAKPGFSRRLSSDEICCSIKPPSCSICPSPANHTCDVCFVPCVSEGLTRLIQNLQLSEDCEIIISALATQALSAIVQASGAIVVTADIDPSTFQLSPSSLERAITKNTKVIIATHRFGSPCQIANIAQIANQYNITLIEDCTQATGAQFFNKPVGSYGHFSIFCFDAPNEQTSYEGAGAIFVQNLGTLCSGSLANLRDFFQPYDRDAIRLFGDYCLRERVRNTNSGWFAAIYADCLSSVPEVQLPGVYEHAKPIWNVFPVRVKNLRELLAALDARGIAVQVPGRPAIQNDIYSPADRVVRFAVRIADSTILLPIVEHITDDDIRTICHEIGYFFGVRHRKRWPFTNHAYV